MSTDGNGRKPKTDEKFFDAVEQTLVELRRAQTKKTEIDAATRAGMMPSQQPQPPEHGPDWSRPDAKLLRLGKRSKLTRDVVRELCLVVSQGHEPQTAARLCGVSLHALASWRKRADEGGLYAELEDALAVAAAQAEHRWVGYLDRAARVDAKNWRAGAWLLERARPERYYLRHEPEVAPVEVQAALNVAVTTSSADDQLTHVQAAAAMRAAFGGAQLPPAPASKTQPGLPSDDEAQP